MRVLYNNRETTTIGYSTIILSAIIAVVVISKWNLFSSWDYNDLGSLVNDRGRKFLCLSPKLREYLQPKTNCNFCKFIKEIKRETKLKPNDFEEWYAYNSMPVIVTDAQVNWTARKIFTVDYFIHLYKNHHSNDGKMMEHRSHCQFFPYNSPYNNLEQALADLDLTTNNNNKSSHSSTTLHVGEQNEDARLRDNEIKQPWYFGWSNCDPTISSELRNHYSRPYFLPKNSHLSLIDWIFMGEPGHGSNMHVDEVHSASWQAQIRGRKKWTLLPPLECYASCHKLEFIVESGETLILDTNVWFHQTKVVGDEISIVIGSEYD